MDLGGNAYFLLYDETVCELLTGGAELWLFVPLQSVSHDASSQLGKGGPTGEVALSKV